MTGAANVAVVLSGGGMNATLMEVGFLRRLRETSAWSRVSVLFGTSAGALAGCMAALDRVEALETFLLRLQPAEAFRANRLWRLPLTGTHDYVLPSTLAARLGEPLQMARELADAERELVVVVTDLTSEAGDGTPTSTRLFERAYSSRTTPPEEMVEAVLASAAISALVLPMPVGGRVATDGGWVRNFPLGYAYERPEVEQIVAFRYEPSFSVLGAGPLASVVRRLRRYALLPPARALLAELERAVERESRGEPAHIVDIFSRLSRVSIIRNTAVEEVVATWRDRSIEELATLREDVLELVAAQPELAARVEERFASARFPFRHDRRVPRVTVSGSAGELSLDPGFRNPRPWTEETKRALIDRGYALADEEFRRRGLG